MNLILLNESDHVDASCVTLTDARATHLLKVLRVTTGQTVRVGWLDGPLGTARSKSVSDGRVTMRCVFETETPPRPRVDVLLALPRPKVLRRLWAQFAALGVGQIILTNASRVERDYFDTHVVDRGLLPAAAHRRPAAGAGHARAAGLHSPSVQDPR